MTMNQDDAKQGRQRMSEPVGPIRDEAAARKALGYFKVMAITAGLALFVLVAVIASSEETGRSTIG